MQQTEKTGSLIALKDVLPEDELMMITKGGVIIRCPVDGIRVSGRNTQGVKLMNLDAGDQSSTWRGCRRKMKEERRTPRAATKCTRRDRRRMSRAKGLPRRAAPRI